MSDGVFPDLKVEVLDDSYHFVGGLTKREYFAGLAMQGLCSRYTVKGTKDDIVAYSTSIADALIAELEREK